MGVIYSTGAVDFRSGEGSSRKMLEDCVLELWSGTAPATADEAPTGTKLCKITLGSGAVSSTAILGRSVPKLYGCTMSGSCGASSSSAIIVTVDGKVTTATFSAPSSASLRTTTAVDYAIARMLNDLPQISAIAKPRSSTPAGRLILVQGRIAGLDFVVAQGSYTGPNMSSIAKITTASSVNTIRFGASALGVISKASGVWSGVNLATGVAGYFRFVLPGDSGVLSTTDVRVQGTIATSGADLNMSNTTLTISATTTIDTATITMPKSA